MAIRVTLIIFVLAALLIADAVAGFLPKTVYLARHGQTEWNRIARIQGDPDIDQIGYINRASLYLLMHNVPLSGIYTSSKLRTKRTAELVAMDHALKPKAVAYLDEINKGIFVGMCRAHLQPVKATDTQQECLMNVRNSTPNATLVALKQIHGKLDKNKFNPNVRPPLGESFSDLAERTKLLLTELQENYDINSTILVVGHGVTNRSLLHHFMGWPLKKVMRITQHNDQVYRVENPGTPDVELSLYTPDHGWRTCNEPRKVAQRYLECNPLAKKSEQSPYS